MRAEGDRITWDGGTLIRLHDGVIRFGRELFPDPDGAVLPEEIVLPVQAYLLLRQGMAPVLIDTGEGAGGEGGVARALAREGVAPRDIGTVVFTHLHTDHCLGYLAGGYEGARVCLTAAEAQHWQERDHPARQVLARAAERTTLLSDGDEVTPGLRVWALPGHTPGHAGLVIDGRVAVVGDLLHRADFQLADPDLATRYDHDAAQATSTRKAALDEVARRDLALCGGHLRLPGQEATPDGASFLRLAPQGSGWRAVAA